MTTIICVCLLLINFSFANIPFEWTQPRCDPDAVGWSGCLRGQRCLSDGSCRNSPATKILSRQSYSIDGRCGPDFGGAMCDPFSTNYHGTCCSQYGWCGNTVDHCGSGCVSGCAGSKSSASSSIKPRQTDSPGPNSASISSNGAIGEPTLGASSSSTSNGPVKSGSVTTDGTCGASNGGTICGDWPKGSCCSMYGFCGNTAAHCGDGCQSGPCLNGATIPAPGPSPAPANANGGTIEIIGQSGVPPMHAALMQNGRVMFLDKVENYTQLVLPDGYFAYSSEFDPENGAEEAIPLAYSTNAFCSGGAFLRNGRLINVGGNGPLDFIDPTVGDGFTALRYLSRSATDPSLTGQPWSEPGNKLSSARWYASAQTGADGSILVASGSLNGLNPAMQENNNPTYEFLDQDGVSSGQSIPMDILVRNQPYYMYPILHLLSDGTMFIFVSKSAEQWNTLTGETIRVFPDLPGEYRTYPNTGGSVLLPLLSENDFFPEIMICGGGAYQDITSPTDASCGRISPLADNAVWEMESMPEGRCMVEGTVLPDGTVIWLNGAQTGAQGFGLATNPAYEVLIYDPGQPVGQRFTTGPSSSIARLYHSVALLLPDGTVLIAGSNPVEQPILEPSQANPYVTEFRVERYTPPYLSGGRENNKPTDITLPSTTFAADSSTVRISFSAPQGATEAAVVLHHNGFVTHSLHMGNRMIRLASAGFVADATHQTLTVTMPPNNNIAPPGPYLLFVLINGTPGVGQFISIV